MTMICTDCKGEMGERCPRCGTLTAEVCQVNGRPAFICVNADCTIMWFRAGVGGRTDGLCEPCVAKRLRELQGLVELWRRPMLGKDL